MKGKIVCIIGYGSIGKKYADLLKKNFKNFKIILVRSGKHKKNKNSFDEVIGLKNILELKPFFCIISSYTSEHINNALFLAKNNIPFFVEKPLSNNLKNLSKLNSVIKKKKLLNQVGYVFRHKKLFKYLKQILLKENIISANIICVSDLKKWRKGIHFTQTNSAQKKFGGGVLLELSHEIDYCRFLFDEITHIICNFKSKKNLKLNVEDEAKIYAKTKKNILLSIFLSFSSKIENRSCTIMTDKGFINFDIRKNEIIYYGKKISFKKDKQNMYLCQLKYFLSSLKKSKKGYPSIEDGIKTQKVLSAATKSNIMKKEMKLSL